MQLNFRDIDITKIFINVYNSSNCKSVCVTADEFTLHTENHLSDNI